MSKVSTILIPTDFSEVSFSTAKYGLGWATLLNSNVTLLHVVPRDPNVIYPLYLETEEEWKKSAEKELVNFAKSLKFSKEEKLKTKVRVGVPYSEIIKEAEKENANMIIMGTHGRKGLPRIALGSVAERVVQMAPCPVLVFRGGAHE